MKKRVLSLALALCLCLALMPVASAAEDLGDLRPEVLTLRDHYHLKGMKVFQFMLNDGYDNLENSFFYSGTHDNETIKGWISGLNEEDIYKLKAIVDDDLPLNEAVLKFCLQSDASDVIIPIWDLLEVDNDQRFNTPGVVNDTNWTYRVANIDDVTKAMELFKNLSK